MAIQASACPGVRVRRMALMVAMALPALAEAQEAVVLPEVKVQAQALGETTEGSGSYTTGKTRTATPLGTSLRDTPQSVSVVTQQRIEDQGMRSVMDVVDNATGVSVNRFETNRVKFTARGFDIKSLMIDGVPTTWDPTWTAGEVFSSLAIYDRVEMVRGSTGLVSGTGDPSAAINLVRKRAASKTLTGAVELGVGSWNRRRAMADVSTPVNEAGTLRARLVGEYTQGDSWVELKKDKSQTMFATMEADLTPNTLLSAGISRQEIDSNGPMWGGLPYWYADGTRTDWSRSKTTSAKWTRWDSSYENWFAKLEHRFDNDWKVRASYSNGDRKGDTPLLYLFGAPNRLTGLGMTTWPGHYQNRTKQSDFGLSATGPFQLAGRTHELAFGYTYSKQKFNADSRSAPLGAAGNFNEWDGSHPEPAWGAWSFYQKDQTTQEAIYGAVRFNLTDPLKLILGARVTNWRKAGVDATGAELYEMKFDHQITPYAGIVYDLNENYSIYSSYTDIFQPQQVRDINGKYLNPVIGKSAEVGIKGEFLDGRLNGSLALFRIKQEKLGQESAALVPNGTPGEKAYRESDGATSEGFEIDLAGELTPGWNVSVGYTNFQATFADGSDANSIYPRQLLRTFTSYRLPGQWSRITVGGGINWEGRTYTHATNPLGATDRVEQDSYTLVNLMARYEFSKQLSAQLNINNLLDTKYFGMYAASDQITYGAPRNANLVLRYKF